MDYTEALTNIALNQELIAEQLEIIGNRLLILEVIFWTAMIILVFKFLWWFIVKGMFGRV